MKPSIFSDEDYLPPRPQPHDYMREIYAAWKKTARGYSGDIAIPVTFFEGGKLTAGYEVGLAFRITKVVRPTRPPTQQTSSGSSCSPSATTCFASQREPHRRSRVSC